MKYEKPEVVQFGPAINAVQSSMDKGTGVFDSHEILSTSSAFEADE